MRIFLSTVVLASAAAVVSGQQANEPVDAVRVAPEVRAKVIAELASAAGARGGVKGVPFSAEEVNESVQTLADGNRIVRNSTGKFYRNSEGRIRRESSGGTGGVFGTTFMYGQGVSIVSPDLGSKYLLDSNLKTARVIELEGQNLAIAGSSNLAAKLRSNAETSPQAMVDAEKRAVEMLQRAGGTPGVTFSTAPMAQGSFAYTTIPSATNSKYETRTEELGTRDFEGVSAEGTRRTTTIPAGAIGNERPIEVVYERWYSKELGMVVYSRNTDPRMGEQTYKLTNIVRAEPDPSLFSIPTHYKKVSETGTYYRVGEPRAVKPSAPAKAVNVSSPAKAARP